MGKVGDFFKDMENHNDIIEKCSKKAVEKEWTLMDVLDVPEFRRAIHVPDYVQPYKEFSPDVRGNYRSVMESSAWIYDLLYLHGYRMLHLMGDTDAILSLAGAWAWIRQRKFKVTRPWTAWLDKQGELVGFVKEYSVFKFATVHGGGHGGSI